MSEGGETNSLPSNLVGELVDLLNAEAVSRLRDGNWWNSSTAEAMALWALEEAEVDGTRAGRAVELATIIAADAGNPPALVAQIAYAAARAATHLGDLAEAERALLVAQSRWQQIDARGSAARAYLGLTQVLAMQGRYEDAGVAARSAVSSLQSVAENDPGAIVLLSRAYRNLGNLLVYQEQHAAAREAYAQAVVELERFRSSLPAEQTDAGEQAALDEEFGHLALNLASAHTFLDAPDEAERLLLDAISRFERAQDLVNRGRSQTNLGRLYLRLGEYARALAIFDEASSVLMGDLSVQQAEEQDAELAALRQADELLLEHALAYLSLNLLPEAALALERGEKLFRATGQPYELAQARSAQGILLLQQDALDESENALDEALALYTELGNPFWRNRTQIAQARLFVARGNRSAAEELLDRLLAAPEMTTREGALAWDLTGLVEAWLMRLQLWLDAGNVALAQEAAQAIERILGVQSGEALLGAELISLPHLTLRLLHGRGRIAAATGDHQLARRFHAAATDLLDRQRATLPLEEIRTAYLDDKMAIYGDLVVSLLAAPLPNEDEVAAAFAVVERARSRALLERLLASVEAEVAGESAALAEQRSALRRQLHWLYNQLLGDSGNRHVDGALSREVAQHEAAIQQLEWRSAPLLSQAEPVRLEQLQEILDPDQQAVVYFFAGNEVLAFVVGRNEARVVRGLTTVDAVEQAQAEMRFQIGRAEMGSDYVTRHYERLLHGTQRSLGRLYELLVAPLQAYLHAERLYMIPYGLLHLVPFHALWDGEGYWLERVEIAYVPSASIAVHTRRVVARPLNRFAGFAPYDEHLPQAQAEIELAATYFSAARRYHHGDATVANLADAAGETDVLHLATHGLFRPDNSFFSAIKLADGWIDVREIYRLRLRAQLVVLSACESGVGEVRAGDEVVGLARGFLAAGTRNLIASLWNVHDRSAANLMQHFYQVLQGESGQRCMEQDGMEQDGMEQDGDALDGGSVRPASALRQAQIAALRAGALPYFWAPFFAIG
jgi:CHAT domain-containing protein